MGDDLVRIRDVLDGFGVKVGLGRSKDASVIWSRWSEIVGDAVAAHAEPSSLRDGVLKVRADSPTWAAELGYLVEEIRTRANALVGRQSVVEVRVWTSPGRVAGEAKRRTRGPSSASPAATEEATKRPPTTDPQEAFERAREAWRRRNANEGQAPDERS
jgi:predicted nucleic acid-binding Zn ribbon protein